MPRLQTIIASTRPGRVGRPIGEWFHARAVAHGAFEAELLDLREIDLPFLDEPNHPRLHRYTHEHTQRWSETITRGDAFVWVTPEYNHGMPATLKNAVDFLFLEWSRKPLGIVSYGGVSAGLRSAQQLKQVAGSVGLVPVGSAVSIPFVQQVLSEDRTRLEASETLERSADAMLDELVRVEAVVRALR